MTQKRRTQMLEAAMEVIAERVFCETRIADVADRWFEPGVGGVLLWVQGDAS